VWEIRWGELGRVSQIKQTKSSGVQVLRTPGKAGAGGRGEKKEMSALPFNIEGSRLDKEKEWERGGGWRNDPFGSGVPGGVAGKHGRKVSSNKYRDQVGL